MNEGKMRHWLGYFLDQYESSLERWPASKLFNHPERHLHHVVWPMLPLIVELRGDITRLNLTARQVAWIDRWPWEPAVVEYTESMETMILRVAYAIMDRTPK